MMWPNTDNVSLTKVDRLTFCSIVTVRPLLILSNVNKVNNEIGETSVDSGGRIRSHNIRNYYVSGNIFKLSSQPGLIFSGPFSFGPMKTNDIRPSSLGRHLLTGCSAQGADFGQHFAVIERDKVIIGILLRSV